MLTEMKFKAVGQVDGVEYPLIHISQAAKIHGNTIGSIRKMANQGEIIAIKEGRDWFVSETLIRIESLAGMNSPP